MRCMASGQFEHQSQRQDRSKGLPLIQVMFSAQVINGLLLPIILVFVMLLAGDSRIMGRLVSGRVNLALGWFVTGILVVMSTVLVVTALTT